MKGKIKRFFKRTLTSFLALGMFFSYLPQTVYAAEEEAPIVSETVKEETPVVEVNEPVQEEVVVSVEEIAPETNEPEQEVIQTEEVVPTQEEIVETEETQEEVIAEETTEEVEEAIEEEAIEEEAIEEETTEEVEEAIEEDAAEEVVTEEEIIEEVTSNEETPVAPQEKIMQVRPKMMLGAPRPNPNPNPAPTPKGDPDEAKDLYPDNTNMQDLYVQYGDDFKDATNALIDETSTDNVVTVINSMNSETEAISNPESISGMDKDKNSIEGIIMADGKDNDGDGFPDPVFFSYTKDDVTNNVTISMYEEKEVEGINDLKVEKESDIDAIIEKYGKENTSVDKYYDEDYEGINQPNNGGKHVNMFPTNQNGVKFEEPITTTDSNGNRVYLYNYQFTLGNKTATVENGDLRWDVTKKRTYGDKGYGCWIFIDDNGVERNLTNMSTTSTGSHNIKAQPYSDEYMASIDKDLYEWFVESSDKNGKGNSYTYGNSTKTFKYAIVNAEGWSYFEELSSNTLSKSKPKDNPDPTPGPGGDPDPTPGPGGDPDPTPGPGGDPDPTPGPGGDPDPTPGPGGDPDPTPGPGPSPLPKPAEPTNSSVSTISVDNPIEKTIYLVVIDDNIGFSKNEKNLLNDFLKGISLANRNSEFRFVYASKVTNGSLNGVNTIVTVGDIGSDSLLSKAMTTAILKGNKIKVLNLWFFDDISMVDDDMEGNNVDIVEANINHIPLYVNSFSVRNEFLSNKLIQAGREFIKTGSVDLETIIWIMIS